MATLYSWGWGAGGVHQEEKGDLSRGDTAAGQAPEAAAEAKMPWVGAPLCPQRHPMRTAPEHHWLPSFLLVRPAGIFPKALCPPLFCSQPSSDITSASKRSRRRGEMRFFHHLGTALNPACRRSLPPWSSLCSSTRAAFHWCFPLTRLQTLPGGHGPDTRSSQPRLPHNPSGRRQLVPVLKAHGMLFVRLRDSYRFFLDLCVHLLFYLLSQSNRHPNVSPLPHASHLVS